ncbi:MAG: transposase, partial [Treponema sp.]|nr:transposase [Treponema sp.]
VKAYSRKKPGRKALDASLLRVEKVVDLAESEKTCVCGTKLTWPKNVLFQMKNLFYLKNCLFFVFV